MPQTSCLITGTIKDSGGNALTGQLIVTLDAPLFIDSTTPDSYHTIEPKPFDVNAGAVSLTLVESETQKITYRFQFFKLLSGSLASNPVFAAKPLIDFRAMIPDVASYEFAALSPTGITTDRLDTGALRVARQILANPLLNSDVKKVLGLYRQSSEPVPTANGDVWIDSDNGQFWVWDATLGRWLSNLRTVSVGLEANLATGEKSTEPITFLNYNEIQLLQIDFRWKMVSAPLDSTNNWTIQAGYRNDSNSSLTLLGTPNNVFGLGSAISTMKRASFVPGAPLAYNLDSLEYFGIRLVKSNSPGPIDAVATFTYRVLLPE